MTKDIPDNSVVVGVPARVIKSLDEYMVSSLSKSIQIVQKEAALRYIEIIEKLAQLNK